MPVFSRFFKYSEVTIYSFFIVTLLNINIFTKVSLDKSVISSHGLVQRSKEPPKSYEQMNNRVTKTNRY